MAKPLQQPHPPIVVTVVAPFSKGVTEAAARGWEPISANFLLPCWVASHWPKYQEGCARAGRPADPANWRVARPIFVADDLNTARDYALGANSPYRYYYNQLLTKMKKHGRTNLFKEDPSMSDDAVTIDHVLERCVLWARRTRWQRIFWPCGKRLVTSARCFMLAKTGSIRIWHADQ